MGGFVIDVYIGFLVRWIVILWRNAASCKWPIVAGSVVHCHFEEHGYGGDYVVLQYKVEWERFEGVLKKPFIYENYAEAYTRHHPADSQLRIHVDPKDPTRSFPVLDL